MSKRAQGRGHGAVPADPHQWSEQSRHSVSFYYTREYVDLPTTCRRCGTACVFTAQDQKYTFEVKKASIDQRRALCAGCWSKAHQLRAALSEHEARWAVDRNTLRADREFLGQWLELLNCWKQLAPYKHDVAKIEMVRGLLKLE